MFSFFSKKPTINQLPITIDMHSHVLPGLDDGSPDIETSMALIKGLSELGVKKMIATPHIIGDLYRNTPDNISYALMKVQFALKASSIPVEIQAAAEYMLDDHFMKLLHSGSPLLKLKDNLILTEQSYATPTNNLEEIVFEIITNGYSPILAHPERYNYYHHNYKYYHRLTELGFLLQVNLLSLTGYYGKPVAKAAAYILKNDLASFVGTDLHHARHLEAFQQHYNLQLFEKFVEGKGMNEGLS